MNKPMWLPAVTWLCFCSLLVWSRSSQEQSTLEKELLQSQGPHTAAAVIAADKGWTIAEEKGDVAYVEALLLPEYRSISPALFNPQSGRLDAARIASEIQLPVSTIAEAIGKKAPSVRKHPDASSLQPELRRVYRIWVAIVELYAGNKKSARIFLNAPNKHLENQAPVEFIEGGDLKPLEALVEAMNTRQPA